MAFFALLAVILELLAPKVAARAVSTWRGDPRAALYGDADDRGRAPEKTGLQKAGLATAAVRRNR